MSVVKGGAFVALCLVLCISASSCILPPEDLAQYFWEWIVGEYEAHPLLCVNISESCEVTYTDRYGNPVTDVEVWAERPVKFTNKSQSLIHIIDFEDDEFVTAADEIRLGPQESFETTFRSQVPDDAETVSFEITCWGTNMLGQSVNATQAQHLSWKYPPPDPQTGPPPP
jgi:hypothetical protein